MPSPSTALQTSIDNDIEHQPSPSLSYQMSDNDHTEHFSERSLERQQFFDEAASRLPTALSPFVWAFFQCGDLCQLEKISHSEISWKTATTSTLQESYLERQTNDTMRAWRQLPPTKRTASPATTPTPSPLKKSRGIPTDRSQPTSSREFSPVRDRGVAERSKERDDHRCVISWTGAVDACHIYPWSAFGGKNGTNVQSFWDTLRAFWSKDKVDRWFHTIFQDSRPEDPRGTETVANMITFTQSLHRFHTEGAFALRPVCMSADKKRLELEFHWLPRKSRFPKEKVDLLEMPESSRGLQSSGDRAMFFRMKPPAGLLISGDRFEMTTDDPLAKPLPDPGLLEMQWHLQRVLAMSGAAEWTDEDFDYEDPDGDAAVLQSTEQSLEYPLSDFYQTGGSASDDSVDGEDGAYDW